MGDVDNGRNKTLVEGFDLGPHLNAEIGIRIGQRLVEQEHIRIAHDGLAHRDPLALANGELRRFAGQKRCEAQNVGGALDIFPDLILWQS